MWKLAQQYCFILFIGNIFYLSKISIDKRNIKVMVSFHKMPYTHHRSICHRKLRDAYFNMNKNRVMVMIKKIKGWYVRSKIHFMISHIYSHIPCVHYIHSACNNKHNFYFISLCHWTYVLLDLKMLSTGIRWLPG